MPRSSRKVTMRVSRIFGHISGDIPVTGICQPYFGFNHFVMLHECFSQRWCAMLDMFAPLQGTLFLNQCESNFIILNFAGVIVGVTEKFPHCQPDKFLWIAWVRRLLHLPLPSHSPCFIMLLKSFLFFDIMVYRYIPCPDTELWPCSEYL